MVLFIIILGFIIIMVSGLAGYLYWRRSMLPDHLKPYFKDSADLDNFIIKQKLADEQRRQELTNPVNTTEAAEYLLLNNYDVESATFKKALQMVEDNLNENPCEYGQMLGEIYAFSQVYGDSEKAYYFYLIGLSQDEYSVGFRDENHDPPNYCGPVGDFRNEPQVSEIVDKLGFERTQQLDIKARQWLTINNFKIIEFQD